MNLSWALNRMEKVVTNNKDKPIPEIKELLHKECVAIKDEDVWMCRQIGEYGLSLIKDGDGILTATPVSSRHPSTARRWRPFIWDVNAA